MKRQKGTAHEARCVIVSEEKRKRQAIKLGLPIDASWADINDMRQVGFLRTDQASRSAFAKQHGLPDNALWTQLCTKARALEVLEKFGPNNTKLDYRARARAKAQITRMV